MLWREQGGGEDSVSDKRQVQPLLVHVCASERYLWSGTKKAVLCLCERQRQAGYRCLVSPPLNH